MPALAVANELRRSGAEVEFAGGDRVEARMVPAAGYTLHRFATAGFERRLSTGTLRSAWLAGTAPLACRRIIAAVRPDVVFGAGGYVSGPMLLAAKAARIPAALLEVDAHMGLANRMAVPLVRQGLSVVPDRGPQRRQVRGDRKAESRAPFRGRHLPRVTRWTCSPSAAASAPPA